MLQDLKHATDAGKVEFNKEEERLVHQGHEVDAHFELVYQLLRCGTTRTQDIRFEQAIAALEGVYTPPVWPGPGEHGTACFARLRYGHRFI